jgi:hypothetical protein
MEEYNQEKWGVKRRKGDEKDNERKPFSPFLQFPLFP